MPRVKVFGYRWLLAKDDGIFIGPIDSVIYTLCALWCCFKAYDWFHLEGRYFCDNPVLQDVVFVSFCLSVTGQMFLGIGMIYSSMQGTVCQENGGYMSFEFLCRIKTIFVVLGFLWLTVAYYLFFKDNFCDASMKQTLTIAAAFQSTVSVSQVIVGWLIFDSEWVSLARRTKVKTARSDFFLHSPDYDAASRFKLRSLGLILWSYPCSKAMRHAAISVPEIFAYVPRELDVAFTEFAFGVVLLKQKYMKRYQEKDFKMDSFSAITRADGSPVDQFPTTDMPAWMNLLLARKHFRSFHDAFPLSWSMILNGVLRFENAKYLMKKLRAPRQDCRQKGVKRMQSNLGSLYRDSIHVSFQKKTYFIPFRVNTDADTSSIVIIIGGSMSTSDILIDIVADLPSTEAGSTEDICYHTGMLKASQRIKDMLERNNILEIAFKGHRGYHLVTTGHNLGASIAAILALLLRPLTPMVRCFAFEPVPCIRFGNLDTTFDTIFSVVFNNNVIPFLSFYDVEHMVKKIVKSAREYNLPKHKEQDATAGSEDREVHNSSIEQLPESRLYMPGRILHIRHSNNRYRLQILSAKDFEPLMILPDMVTRHSLQYVEESLEHLGLTDTLLSANL